MSAISLPEQKKPLTKSGLESGGGADRDRTDDLLHAMQALFQLSYGPSDSSRTRRQQSACLASENLRGLGSAFGSVNDPQVHQFTLKSDRAEFRPKLL